MIMKTIANFIEMFRMLFVNDCDDAYTEYLSEQPGTYVDIKDVYNN